MSCVHLSVLGKRPCNAQCFGKQSTNGPCSIGSAACGTTVPPPVVLGIRVWQKKATRQILHEQRKRTETCKGGGSAGYRTKLPHQLRDSSCPHVLSSMVCRNQTGHLLGCCSPPNAWLLSECFVFPWEITQLNICSWKENRRRQTATTY